MHDPSRQAAQMTLTTSRWHVVTVMWRGNCLDGRDPKTGKVVSLFNPRRARWAEHCIWDVAQLGIVGHTPTGRVTVEFLDLNDDRHEGSVIRIRQRDLADGYHPLPDDHVLSA